jgi:hypothetical protein
LLVVVGAEPEEVAMNTQDIKDEAPRFEENDPPLDLTREEAAFERERARLVRDHLGEIALIHGDEVVAVFATLPEAERYGYGRFGNARLIFRPITEKDEPEWVSFIDINHPCIKRID